MYVELDNELEQLVDLQKNENTLDLIFASHLPY